jgi:hypothetical protein
VAASALALVWQIVFQSIVATHNQPDTTENATPEVLGQTLAAWGQLGAVDLIVVGPWYHGVRLIAPDLVVLLSALVAAKFNGRRDAANVPVTVAGVGAQPRLFGSSTCATLTGVMLLLLAAVALPGALSAAYVLFGLLILLRWSRISARLSVAPMGLLELRPLILSFTGLHAMVQYAFQFQAVQDPMSTKTAAVIGLHGYVRTASQPDDPYAVSLHGSWQAWLHVVLMVAVLLFCGRITTLKSVGQDLP